MALNNPYQVGYVQRPRISVQSNGVELPNAVSANVVSNNHFQADRFSLCFVPSPSGIGSLAWWSQQTTVPINVRLGFVPQGATEGTIPSWQSLVIGTSDKITIEFDAMTVSVEGRDLTAAFIDTKTQDAHVNETSSAAVAKLAANHGIPAQITKTTTPIGRFWATENSSIDLNQFHRVTTEWDLITTLARFEGFDAFVSAGTFYFQPITQPTATPYIWYRNIDQYGRMVGNVTGLHMERALTISKGVRVVVKSWNTKQAKSFEVTAGASASGVTSGKAQQYIFVKPNMTKDQAQQYANARYAEIIRHEMTISASMPGDMILTPRCMVRLMGTGTAFDQVYYPASVTRDVSVSRGFTMSASCKNHSTESETDVG